MCEVGEYTVASQTVHVGETILSPSCNNLRMPIGSNGLLCIYTPDICMYVYTHDHAEDDSFIIHVSVPFKVSHYCTNLY